MDKYSYRILEKVYTDRSEYHPQVSHDGKEWHSILMDGVSLKKAEKIINEIKRGKEKPIKEIIHER